MQASAGRDGDVCLGGKTLEWYGRNCKRSRTSTDWVSESEYVVVCDRHRRSLILDISLTWVYDLDRRNLTGLTIHNGSGGGRVVALRRIQWRCDGHDSTDKGVIATLVDNRD